MTREEFIQSLDVSLSYKAKQELLAQWDIDNPKTEEVEEVKTKVVADQAGAAVATTTEEASDTALKSEDGSLESKPLATIPLDEIVISNKPEVVETVIGSSEILDDVEIPLLKYSDFLKITNEAERLIDVAKKAGYSDIPEKKDLINAIRSKDRSYLRDLKKNINTDIRITNAANDLYRSELYNEEEE